MVTIEGTWEEIARHAPEFAGKRLRVMVLASETDEAQNRGMPRPAGQVFFGMFSGSPQPTEEDFKTAEFHGDPDDGLDWR